MPRPVIDPIGVLEATHHFVRAVPSSAGMRMVFCGSSEIHFRLFAAQQFEQRRFGFMAVTPEAGCKTEARHPVLRCVPGRSALERLGPRVELGFRDPVADVPTYSGRVVAVGGVRWVISASRSDPTTFWADLR